MSARGGVTPWVIVVSLVAGPAAAEYQAKGRRDPMVPLLTVEGQRIHPPGVDDDAAPEATRLVLQGIVYDATGNSYAIVNDHVVHEQDTVDGMIVLRIQPMTVTMLVDGQRRELTVAPPAAQDNQGITP
ncbi:MAG: hypothetical protein HY600_07120 [Candidatus Omnitrophica bacterium]|nr:hypothetical protein [Candidatus Omnitrophota bacterium]